MEDALTAFGLVFVAELGDKSMLLAIALAARYRPLPVLAGIACAAVSMLGLSALAGTALGSAVPTDWVSVVGGLVFLGFAAWTLLGPEEDDEEEPTQLRSGSVLLGVTLTFIVAELADKTMLVTAALAGTRAAVPTWLGASAGMTAASGLAIAAASWLGARIPRRRLDLLAAAAFAIFGLLLLVDGLLR